MGIFKKLNLHLADKYLATQMQGMKLANETPKDMPAPVQVAGLFGGILFGSAVGIFRLWNPTDIFDSVLTSEKKLEERINKKFDSAS